MGSDLVVTLAPVFDSDLRIDSVLEPLHPETLVPELSVEALVVVEKLWHRKLESSEG